MSELTAAVDASETLWEVDAVPDPEFGYYTVGSEIVQVIAGFPGGDPGYAVGQTFPAKIRVIRATNGTTAATHADGVALTAANAFSAGGGAIAVTDGTTTVEDVTTLELAGGIVTDEGAGVVGVAVSMRLLGPFAVAFNTPGLNNPSDNGALIVAIPAGTLVRAFLMVNTVWSAAGEFILSLSSPDRSTTAQTLGGYTAQGDAADAFSQIEGVSAYPGDQSALSRYGFTIQDCVITASFFPDAGDPTTGAGDIYVLIAEPA